MEIDGRPRAFHPARPGIDCRGRCSEHGKPPGALKLDEKELERLRPWEAYADQLGASDYDRYSVNRWMRLIFGIPFMKESNPLAYDRFNALTADFEKAQPEEILGILQKTGTPNCLSTS